MERKPKTPGGFLLPALVSPGAKPCLALPQIETSGSEKDEKLSDGFFCFRGCLYFEEAFFGGDAGGRLGKQELKGILSLDGKGCVLGGQGVGLGELLCCSAGVT